MTRILPQLICWVAGAAVAVAGENLVPGGDFSKPDPKSAASPLGWSLPNGKTSLWDAKAGVLRMDTAVLKGTVSEPQVERTKAGAKDQYDTVGAHEGAWLFTRPIEILADDVYFLIEADVRGPRSTDLFYPKILLRGYQIYDPARHGEQSSFFHQHFPDLPAFSEMFGEKDRPAQKGEYLMNWRSTLHCRLQEEDKWQHFVMAFKMPKEKRYFPEVLLVKCFAYWPLGVYEFDNVSVRRATKAEFDEAKKNPHNLDGFSSQKKTP